MCIRDSDNYGHDVGDIVLQNIAQTVLSCVRKTDAVIRYGGDEFVIIFFNIPPDIFGKKLERIRYSVDSLIIDDRPELHMSVSIGGVYGTGTTKKLFKIADNMICLLYTSLPSFVRSINPYIIR